MGISPVHRDNPYSYKKGPGIFNDHKESAPCFNVSSFFILQYSVPSLYWGHWAPHRLQGWAPPGDLTNNTSANNLNFPIQELARQHPCLASLWNQAKAAGWYCSGRIEMLDWLIQVSVDFEIYYTNLGVLAKYGELQRDKWEPFTYLYWWRITNSV